MLQGMDPMLLRALQQNQQNNGPLALGGFLPRQPTPSQPMTRPGSPYSTGGIIPQGAMSQFPMMLGGRSMGMFGGLGAMLAQRFRRRPMGLLGLQ